MARLRAMIANHPRAAVLSALFVVGLIAFVLVWFEPQALLIDKRVDEALPTSSSEIQGTEADDAEPAKDEGGGDAEREAAAHPEVLARGELRGINHDATGQALLVKLADGSHILRFEDLMAENGPDLRVYLSAASADSEGPAFNDDYVELGPLKGNVGNQNYAIPENVDISRFGTPVIWCKRFEVGFAVADVRPPA